MGPGRCGGRRLHEDWIDNIDDLSNGARIDGLEDVQKLRCLGLQREPCSFKKLANSNAIPVEGGNDLIVSFREKLRNRRCSVLSPSLSSTSNTSFPDSWSIRSAMDGLPSWGSRFAVSKYSLRGNSNSITPPILGPRQRSGQTGAHRYSR